MKEIRQVWNFLPTNNRSVSNGIMENVLFICNFCYQLPVFVCACLSVCLSVYLSACLSVSQLSVSLSSIFLLVCLSHS